MTASVATIAPEDDLQVANDVMSRGGHRQLPVVSGRALVGMLTDRDILSAPRLLARVLGLAVGSRAALKTLHVAQVMASTVTTIEADGSLEDATEQLLRHRVRCLPVLDEGALVGIVTTSDVLRAFVHRLGPDDTPLLHSYGDTRHRKPIERRS
jgi:acetoin utilization protein AcuB